MPCPTCGSETLQIGHNGLRPNKSGAHDGFPAHLNWCPQCGTVQAGDDKGGDVPVLVLRCRQFQEKVTAHPSGLKNDWDRLGIAARINLPDARPSM